MHACMISRVLIPPISRQSAHEHVQIAKLNGGGTQESRDTAVNGDAARGSTGRGRGRIFARFRGHGPWAPTRPGRPRAGLGIAGRGDAAKISEREEEEGPLGNAAAPKPDITLLIPAVEQPGSARVCAS